MFIMFVTKYESSEEINLEQIMTNADMDPTMFERVFYNENYKKALKMWLPFLDKKGYLDNMLPNAVQNGEEVVNGSNN